MRKITIHSRRTMQSVRFSTRRGCAGVFVPTRRPLPPETRSRRQFKIQNRHVFDVTTRSVSFRPKTGGGGQRNENTRCQQSRATVPHSRNNGRSQRGGRRSRVFDRVPASPAAATAFGRGDDRVRNSPRKRLAANRKIILISHCIPRSVRAPSVTT